MRDRFPFAVLAGLVVLAVAGAYLVRGAARGQFADVLSTRRSEPDGARAIYLLAEESGLRVGRHQSDLEVLPDRGQLVLLRVSPSAGERAKLLDHVDRGNTLIYAPAEGSKDPLLETLGVTQVPVAGGTGLRTLVPAQPAVWTRGVERAEAELPSHLLLPSQAIPLLVDSKGGETVAGLVPWGEGQIVVLSAPELAMNKRLALADNAQFWLSLLRAAGNKGPISFDEFHHGFTDDRSMAAFAARYGLHFAILQLLAGVALWTFALRRFGRPKLPAEAERATRTDALLAASNLYRAGRHYGHAASLLVKGLPGEQAGALAERAQVASSERDVEDLARRSAELRRTLFDNRKKT